MGLGIAWEAVRECPFDLAKKRLKPTLRVSPGSPNSSPACALHADRSCPKKLSSGYHLYACGNFFGHSSIVEKIAILGQPPSACKERKGKFVAFTKETLLPSAVLAKR